MKYSLAGIITAGTIAFLPFFPRFGFIYGALGPKALLVTALVLALGLLSLAQLMRKGKISIPSLNLLAYSLIGFLVVQIAASLLGLYPEHSLLGDLTRSTGVVFLLNIVFLAFFTATLLTSEDWVLVRRGVLISSGLVALLTWIGIDGMGFEGKLLWFDFAEEGLTFGNETYAAMYLLLGALFGSVDLVRTSHKQWKRLSIAILAVIATSPMMFNASALLSAIGESTNLANFIGSSRASSITLVAVACFLAMWMLFSRIVKGNLGKVLKIASAFAVVLGVVCISVIHLIPDGPIQRQLSDRTTQARFITWEAVLPAILERPILGWGPDNFDLVFENNFDDSLYLKEGKLEVWFDKAHNPIIETLITTGTIGLLSGIALVLAYISVVYGAYRARKITEAEALLLATLPIAHFMQLQTAFNTVTSYALLAVIGGYVLSLDKTTTLDRTFKARRVLVITIAAICGLSFIYNFVYDLPRQASIASSLQENNFEARAQLVDFALSRTSDFEALHRSSALFSESVFDRIKQEGSSSETKAMARQYLAQYLAAYEDYLEVQPNHYRARMHYAYLLLLDTEWGGNRAQDAAAIVQSSYDLSHENPLTYVLDVMARAYLGDYAGAESVLKTLKANLPSIQLTKDTESWLVKQREIAPKHSFLIIGNL